MANIPTLYQSVTNGARISRNGDIVVCVMDPLAFVTTAQEYQMASQWSRAKQTLGTVNKDRTAFVAKLEVIIGRNGGGCATKGPNKVLQRMVQAMEQCGMDIKDFNLPPNINEDIEIKKKPKTEEELKAAEGDAPAPDAPKAL